MADLEEIIKFLLANERERKVLEALYESKKSFVELKKALNIKHNAELARALKNLTRYVLFENILERRERNRVFSYYQLNSMGRNVLEMVRDVEKYISRKSDSLIFELEEVVTHA